MFKILKPISKEDYDLFHNTHNALKTLEDIHIHKQLLSSLKEKYSVPENAIIIHSLQDGNNWAIRKNDNGITFLTHFGSW